VEDISSINMQPAPAGRFANEGGRESYNFFGKEINYWCVCVIEG